MTVKYARHVNRKETPQSEPIPGRDQVQNNAGGYVFAVDKWARLERFLILGADGGTFYVNEKTLTRDNAKVVEACLAEDAARTVAVIAQISQDGRAPKNDPAILALAIAAASVNVPTRQLAYAALPAVCRIPTHLFHFLTYCQGLRGWSRGLRNAITRWYARFSADDLAFQMVKYQQRDGFSHADVLRLSHAKLSPAHQATLRWALGTTTDERVVIRRMPTTKTDGRTVKYGATGATPAVIMAFEEAKTANREDLIRIIRDHKLTREMVPTEALNDAKVWAALLPHMKAEAVIRNLGKMTAVGLVKPLSDELTTITDLLTNENALRKARIHPLNVLNALKVYKQGHGEKGKLAWDPVSAVVEALDACFYLSFGNVPSTGKKFLFGLDVSGSMSHPIAGTALTCREASAAMAMVTARVEKNPLFLAFTSQGTGRWGRHGGAQDGVTEVSIGPRQRLDDILNTIYSLPFGGTDCALPMQYARLKKLDVDVFGVYTDSETWAGTIQPAQALARYRSESGNGAVKSVVVGMTATEFTIADPQDPQMLDVVGFDLATPAAISAFVQN